MTDDLRVFRELVLWLWQTHEKPWDYSHEDAQLIVNSSPSLLNSSFSTDTELEANLPSETKVSSSFGNRFFYLNPVTDSKIMVPRIQLKCDFGRNIPEIRCRLELFLLNDNAEIKSLGYRFESPEGKNIEGSGIHHYYHIQLTKPPTATVDWLPETQPAFPIDADNPVKLVLALLISLYGLDYLGIVLRDAGNIGELHTYINNLHHTKFATIEWYKIIEVGNKYAEGYKISSNEDGFDTHIHGIYPGCNVRGITESRYNGLTKKLRKNYP